VAAHAQPHAPAQRAGGGLRARHAPRLLREPSQARPHRRRPEQQGRARPLPRRRRDRRRAAQHRAHRRARGRHRHRGGRRAAVLRAGGEPARFSRGRAGPLRRALPRRRASRARDREGGDAGAARGGRAPGRLRSGGAGRRRLPGRGQAVRAPAVPGRRRQGTRLRPLPQRLVRGPGRAHGRRRGMSPFRRRFGPMHSARLPRRARAWLVATCLAFAGAAQAAEIPAASQPDPFVPRPRIVVMTDIANEPDDQMSMVRFLLYSNGFDVEGLIATTSTWMKKTVRPDVIQSVLDAYEKVQPNLPQHAPGFPPAAALRAVVVPGQPTYGMEAVGTGKVSPGSELILRAASRSDARPLWVLGWGGTNTLAQALRDARATRTPAEVEALVAKLRVYTISDQDDAGPWIRREFPALHYIATPSTPDGEQYYFATWTGISGDRFYRNAPGADFTTFSEDWVDASIRGKGPLGRLYPYPCCIHEGDTPSFLGLIDNGLASAMSPAFGGWGGRYVWRQPAGE